MEAYRYAEGASDDNGRPPPRPEELATLAYIDRFGVEAVMGRPVLSAGEIYKMSYAENIETAYRSRKASENWAKWEQDNPNASELLKQIEIKINATD